MDEIKKLFKPECKIMVLIRTPDEPTRDFLMTDDFIDEAIAALLRRKHDLASATQRGE